MLAHGIPAANVEAVIELYGDMIAGHCEKVYPDAEKLLERKPRTFAAWAIENAPAFK